MTEPAFPDDIPENMIELLRAFEKAGREIDALGSLRADYYRTGEIPRAWPRQWELDTLNRRRGELLPMIDERARQLLVGALDEFHGEDPRLAQEIQAFTLWKLCPRPL